MLFPAPDGVAIDARGVVQADTDTGSAAAHGNTGAGIRTRTEIKIHAAARGMAQQAATVTISSELNLLIVGVVLVAFVILAPEGIVGLVQRLVKGERT